MTTKNTSFSSEQLQGLLDGPAGPPPAGVTPNMANPANLEGVVIVTVTLSLVLTTMAIFMRMYTKLFLIRAFHYEDCKYQHYLSQ